MSDLTDFLLARIADDEEVAREAASEAATPWRATHGRQVETKEGGYLVTPEDTYSNSDEPTSVIAQHIARHDPARVLAECEAKRRIIDEHPRCDVHDSPGRECDACLRCGDGSLWPCDTLRAIALPYVDHPDYREDWRA